jgi:hypothetical protein
LLFGFGEILKRVHYLPKLILPIKIAGTLRHVPGTTDFAGLKMPQHESSAALNSIATPRFSNWGRTQTSDRLVHRKRVNGTKLAKNRGEPQFR